MRKYKFLIVTLLLAILYGYTPTDNGGLDIPFKRIKKVVAKTLTTADFNLLKSNKEISCLNKGELLTIESEDEVIGYAYVGRVPTCVIGVCKGPNEINQLSLENMDNYEYMDFYAILDANFTVVNLQIYNYDATYGLQMAGKGWLKQFLNLSASKQVRYGKEVDAVSGATVSAKAFTDEIQHVLQCISIP